MIKLYGISNCDTVKKARSFLNQAGVSHDFHDFKKQGVPVEQLKRWMAEVGWERLVNRQGTTWRKLEPAAQAAVVDAASAEALMLAQPSVIKRPVVETPAGEVLVGFDEGRYARLR
jgi:Spx/MgsR family transcriptional regulator